MALCTLERLVSTGQWESRFRVVESCICPAIWRVTGAAVLAELSIVMVVLGVTGITTCWCAFEGAIDVTLCAGNRLMAPNQRESGF